MYVIDFMRFKPHPNAQMGFILITSHFTMNTIIIDTT